MVVKPVEPCCRSDERPILRLFYERLQSGSQGINLSHFWFFHHCSQHSKFSAHCDHWFLIFSSFSPICRGIFFMVANDHYNNALGGNNLSPFGTAKRFWNSRCISVHVTFKEKELVSYNHFVESSFHSCISAIILVPGTETRHDFRALSYIKCMRVLGILVTPS